MYTYFITKMENIYEKATYTEKNPQVLSGLSIYKLAPFFRHFGGEFKPPFSVYIRRVGFLYHAVFPDVNPFLARFCSVGVASRAERGRGA